MIIRGAQIINLTILECKSSFKVEQLLNIIIINLTILECKLIGSAVAGVYCANNKSNHIGM